MNNGFNDSPSGTSAGSIRSFSCNDDIVNSCSQNGYIAPFPKYNKKTMTISGTILTDSYNRGGYRHCSFNLNCELCYLMLD